MPELGGTLTINGCEYHVAGADCILFVGRLDIDFWSNEANGSVLNIPFGDAVEYAGLSNNSVSIADCPNAQFENSLKPSLVLDHEYYLIQSLDVDSVGYNSTDCQLSCSLKFTASHKESDQQIFVCGNLTAECRKIDNSYLLMTGGPIPIRFANQYLPLLGIPTIPTVATRSQLISIFGHPDSEGGGNRSPLPNISQKLLQKMPGSIMRVLLDAKIPEWIRFRLPECHLRFEIESEIAINLTIMPTGGWMDLHGIGSLKGLYCLPDDLPGAEP